MTRILTRPRKYLRLVPENLIKTPCYIAALVACHDLYILPKLVPGNRSFPSTPILHLDVAGYNARLADRDIIVD